MKEEKRKKDRRTVHYSVHNKSWRGIMDNEINIVYGGNVLETKQI